MPFFITTLHIAIEAETIEDARAILTDLEFEAEQTGVLTETAVLPTGAAALAPVPESFDPAKQHLADANALARGTADAGDGRLP